MRRILLATAILVPMVLAPPACKLASRNRVQSINRMNKGIELYKKNNATGAEKALQEAIQLDPSHAAAHAYLGQIYRKQNKLVDAEKAFSDAIDNMGEDPQAEYWYQLGAIQQTEGDAEGVSISERDSKYQAAIASFQEATKLDPNHYKAHFRMGMMYEKLDQPVKADAAYRKSIEIQPRYPPAFVSLGNMYIDYGFSEVAMSVLDAGTQINDKDARMWNGLGRAYLSLNQPKDAIGAFQKAKAIDPDMPDVLFGLGMAYAELRQRKEAVEALSAFLQKAGSDVPEDKKKAANDTVARMQDVI
jgi:tetratricopeptide (TPR) repeat protein